MQDPDTIESLRLEIATLRARTATLRGEVASAEREVQRLEHIVEVVPGAVWESEGRPGEPGYTMHYVSGEVERIFGYTHAEILRSPSFWYSIMHPDDIPRIMPELDAVAATGGRLSEHRFVTRQGLAVWVETHITIRRDAAGTPIGRSVFAPDVTDRVMAQRAREDLLERSQKLARRLDDVIASVPGLVWEVRELGGEAQTPVFVSDYLTTLVGYRPEEILAEPELWEELTHPEDRERVAAEIAQISAQGSGTFEHRWLTRSGQTLWVESHVQVIAGEPGTPARAHGVTMDITARKGAELERAELREQVIKAQESMLAELSTPLIPLSAEVLVMPLIGAIDADRGHRVLETLLEGISTARARFAILDVTGVPSLDAEAADALIRAARAVGLLGAEVVLTGIRPEVAAMLVTLGADLQGLTVRGTLESGIAHASSRRRS